MSAKFTLSKLSNMILLRETVQLEGYRHQSMQKEWMEIGDLGACPRKIFEVKLFRTSENALLQDRIQNISIIILYALKEKLAT